eukprot:327532_1
MTTTAFVRPVCVYVAFAALFIIIITIACDSSVIWEKHINYHHMVSAHLMDLHRHDKSIEDLQMKAYQQLEIDAEISQCHVFYESDPIAINEAKILNQCPELKKHPQLLHLARHNNDRGFTSRSQYQPFIQDGLFVADFYRCLNNEQMLICASMQITAATKPKSGMRAKHIKQLLHDYGHATTRVNMKPPPFLHW